MWHGKCQSKCKKGWCSIVQSVKTLFTNKDVTAADICFAFLLDIIDSKSRNNDLGFTIFVNFTCFCLTFDSLIYCLRVFIKLTEINFTWNRDVTFKYLYTFKKKSLNGAFLLIKSNCSAKWLLWEILKILKNSLGTTNDTGTIFKNIFNESKRC